MARDREDAPRLLREALLRIYSRPERPDPWAGGGNLPWNEPAFAERMLREHLDDSHGAASRRAGERQAQIDWLWRKLDLGVDRRVLDITCGPGLYAVELARRGCHVTGIDFSPASIRHARKLAGDAGVADRCTFVEADLRSTPLPGRAYDAALFLYGQLGVFPRAEARRLLREAADRLLPGGRLCVELLDPVRIDRNNGTWWYTDDTGLWGDAPFLHLGERFWDEETQTSTERFQVLHLETGQLDEVVLSDAAYTQEEMTEALRESGFREIEAHAAWDGLPLYDAREWLVYVARK